MFEAKFQTFEDRQDGAHAKSRLVALRAQLKRQGVDGFVLPRADRHQNEYVAPGEERLAWLTGFTGSAGALIVLADRAVLFVDGRYTLQARDQVDGSLFEIAHLVETPPDVWVKDLPANTRLGYDPWLHTTEGAEKLAKGCAAADAELVPLAQNPVDAVWTGRPDAPRGAVVLHDLSFAGESTPDKLARIQTELQKLKADTLIVSDAHDVAWTFNIRGNDVSHTPLALAFALVPRSGRPALYLDARRLDNATRDALERYADIREPDTFESEIVALARDGKIIRLDTASAADAFSRLITGDGGKVTRGPSPVAILKAVKNDTEIAGTRAAHARDGAAMARFLAWFERESPNGKLTEIDAVKALETFRRDTGMLKDVSFPSISGAGPNGAIVHYRVTEKTNRRIGDGELFLIDSGGQYQDGTTDITRTLPVGEPGAEMRNRFTLVLKGHIAIATARFPQGVSGAQLDSFARRPLWDAGIDFDHGTGHGVGSYLSVHEGPARISKLGTVPLKRGMILSNEPGYYKTGTFGIRIENLVLVIAAPPIEGAEKDMNAFETLTLAPIERRLIDVALLTEQERAWLDAYHARVRGALTPLLDGETAAWLKAATQPL